MYFDRDIAEGRRQKAEGRRQKIIATVDLTVKNPKIKLIANCITARENRGISCVTAIGNGVIVLV